ncbi:Transcriptional regulator, LacI family [hydrothermal vent metagenome]|uniref:Transcriptional regulator, LacI family n=1 Tax=hydrothermal vent metagenome TaxID=652676 RepID=A0A3B0VF43_9ZZZZ
MTKRITLKDVAKQAGVSYQTVSKVLRGQGNVTAETATRIQTAVQELGYRPNVRARNLRVQHSHLIAYSWPPEPPDVYNPILEKFLQSIIEATEALGHHILAFSWQQKSDLAVEGYRDLIQSGQIDGLILSSVEFNDSRVAYLMDLNFPFVAFGRSNPEWDFPYVDIDGSDGIQQVTNHLLQQGHRRIAILAWPETSRTGEDRLHGYYEAMRQANVNIEPEWVIRGENTTSVGYKMAEQLLQLTPAKRPTALICLSDTMAIGAMNAAQNIGFVVGQDIAITGFDDVPLIQYMRPPLTTVRQPIWEVGQRIIELLFQAMAGEISLERHILLKPKLIIRQSTEGTVTNE